jgi:hypothetical protein
VAALVGTPDVNEVAELFYAIGDAPFEEAVCFEVGIVTLHIHVGGEKHRVALARGLTSAGRSIGADHSQPAIGQEQQPKAAPIKGFACRSGDYIVERGEEVLDGVYVARVLCGRPTRMSRE